MKPYNYSAPDWEPLEKAVAAARLPVEVCGEFMWMCEQPANTHQYKHRVTRQYVHINAHEPESAATLIRPVREF